MMMTFRNHTLNDHIIQQSSNKERAEKQIAFHERVDDNGKQLRENAYAIGGWASGIILFSVIIAAALINVFFGINLLFSLIIAWCPVWLIRTIIVKKDRHYKELNEKLKEINDET